MKDIRRILITFASILVITGCASSVTEGVDGTFFKTADGKVYMLKHHFGDLYGPVPVDVIKLKNALATLGEGADDVK